MGVLTRTTLAAILACSALATAQAGGFARVTNGNDSGPGSLRDALEVQQASKVIIAGHVGRVHQ